MQDRLPLDRRKPLATRGRTIHWGQSRHFDRGPAPSGLPSRTDLSELRERVRLVPIGDMALPLRRSASSNVDRNLYRLCVQGWGRDARRKCSFEQIRIDAARRTDGYNLRAGQTLTPFLLK
jgi:hypothetical protein